MNAAAVNGTWVLLQNCELGLGLMNEMEASRRAVEFHFGLEMLRCFHSSFARNLPGNTLEETGLGRARRTVENAPQGIAERCGLVVPQ